MPSFQDSIVLFFLALMLLGPKKLPALARELGKWIGEFRRASNEFKMQMEEELRASEQADRDKKAEALAASAPPPTAPITEPIPEPEPSYEVSPHLADTGDGFPVEPEPYTEVQPSPEAAPEPLPIATSGGLTMLPPETGLPVAREPITADTTASHTEATHG